MNISSILLSVLFVLSPHRAELQDTACSLLLYCILGSIVTIIKGAVVQYVSWSSYFVVELLYLIGMIVGFLLSTAPILAVVVSSMNRVSLWDLIGPKVLEMVIDRTTPTVVPVTSHDSSLKDTEEMNLPFIPEIDLTNTDKQE